MSEPLVSIIMPTFNRVDKISDTIYSILAQSYDNWELIVVDDKSTDNTRHVVQKFSKMDDRINYIYNEGKKGVPGARNYGLKHIRGKYIAFLDSDDRWIKHHLKNSIYVLEKYNKEVSFALWYEVINGTKKPIDEVEKAVFDKGFKKYRDATVDNVIFFTHENFYENLFLEDFYCYHINTMVFKKSILTDSFMFDENMKSNDDIDFTFRIIMNYGFCLIKDYHYEYYYWEDCIYAFMDRRKLNLEKLTQNIPAINKITHHGKYKVIHYKKRKEYIKKSSFVENKKDWLSYYNMRIAKKLFTMGFINKNINKKKGAYFYLKSLVYNKGTLKYLFKFFKKQSLLLNESLLDLT